MLNNQPINVIFASDDNYLKYTAATLASLLSSFRSNRHLNVYIMTDRRARADLIGKIEELKRIRDFTLHNIVVDARQFENVRTTPGITLATYYRLVMHHMLPAHVQRIFYLDSDIVVRKCLSEIYDIDLDGYLFAGVEDSLSLHYNRKFGLPETAAHINAGVTLVNLEAVRNTDFSEEVDRYMESNRYTITLGDQQILNAAFYQRIKYLPVDWNVHGSMFDKNWRAKNLGISNRLEKEDVERAVRDPAIIHYTYKRKPWLAPDHPRSVEWLKCAAETSFFEQGYLDSLKPRVAKPKAVPKTMKRGPFFSLNKTGGFLKSVAHLRGTRLLVEQLARDLGVVRKKTTSLTPASNHRVPYHFLEVQSAELLRTFGQRQLSKEFVAADYVRDADEFRKLFTNGEPKDLDGGFHENLKCILRTPTISRNLDASEVDGFVILVQRLRQDLFWRSIYSACYYDKDLIFAETSFFGAFANYFDEQAPYLFRKSFGYILDDMGYYFDARNPSRLETFLNSNPDLTPAERARAKALIEKIITHAITKYNFSSVGYYEHPDLPPESVLVIDQKGGDASIEFAGATNRTFELMLDAAIRENPGKSIFFKQHPDNAGQHKVDDTRVTVLPERVHLAPILNQCAKVYVVSSQVGFEAILRGKQVEVFGMPFYAGWGLTNDRQDIPRRQRQLSVEELFHAACIRHSIYINPETSQIVEMEEALDWMLDKLACAATLGPISG